MYGLPSRLFFGYSPLAYNSRHGMVDWLKSPAKAHSRASALVILPSASMMDTRSAMALPCQTVKPCPIPALLSGLIEVPALPVASITLQPDRPRAGFLSLVPWP